MTRAQRIVFSLLILVFLPAAYGQLKSTVILTKKDSLFSSLQHAQNDTSRMKALGLLAWELRTTNPDSSMLLSKEEMKLAEKALLSPQPLIAKAGRYHVVLSHLHIGVFLLMTGHNKEAMEEDSLTYVLAVQLKDFKLQAKAAGNWGVVYMAMGNYPRALEQYSQALKITESVGAQKDIGFYLNNVGTVYHATGDFARGLDYYLRAVKISLAANDKEGIAITYGNMAMTYDNQGNFPLAIDYGFKGLKVYYEIGDKYGYALILGNIGLYYSQLGDTAKAFTYYSDALKIDKTLGNKAEIVRMLINLSNLFTDQKKFTRSLSYELQAFGLCQELGDNHSLAYALRGIGWIYENQGDSAIEKGNKGFAFKLKYPLAKDYYARSMVIARGIGDVPSLILAYANTGVVEMKMENYPAAEIDLLKALGISDSIKELDKQREQHLQLSLLYERMALPRKALQQFKLYTSLKDTLYSREKNKEITRKEMNYEFEKKEAGMRAIQERIDLQNAEEKRRHLLAIYSGAVVLVLLVILAALIYRNNLQKQKANLQLERKNALIEKQKAIVVEQNKHILESIAYAKRIQDAILPAELFRNGEVKEHFVFFSPKDVVSGDFYWRYIAGDELFFAVVDCTGHGVPGALMSMMGYDILESALKDKGLREPAQILEEINSQLIHKLFKSNPDGARDGMDLTLCRLNKKTGLLCFAGAKNDLWLHSGVTMCIHPVDKQSLGDREGLQFNQYEIQLVEGDTVYLFTDGFADQKGGPENKKYMRSRFKKMLEEISLLSCQEQQTRLETEFRTWKQSTWQRDDVLVLGFKWRTSDTANQTTAG